MKYAASSTICQLFICSPIVLLHTISQVFAPVSAQTHAPRPAAHAELPRMRVAAPCRKLGCDNNTAERPAGLPPSHSTAKTLITSLLLWLGQAGSNTINASTILSSFD